MYINLNFICNNEMRPFTLMYLHFNHLEMKTMNSFKSAFEPFSSEYCWEIVLISVMLEVQKLQLVSSYNHIVTKTKYHDD